MWISEETVIISLYSINGLVCITETVCVYCAVRTGSLFIIQVMCFVWFWEQTAIISLYSINWLVCITETECVFCAVRAEALNVIHVKHLPSTCCAYQQDKGAKPGNPRKNNALSGVGKHWIENYFHLVFKAFMTLQEPARLHNVEWRGDLRWWIGYDIEWNLSWLNLSNSSGICVQGLRKTAKSYTVGFQTRTWFGIPVNTRGMIDSAVLRSEAA